MKARRRDSQKGDIHGKGAMEGLSREILSETAKERLSKGGAERKGARERLSRGKHSVKGAKGRTTC